MVERSELVTGTETGMEPAALATLIRGVSEQRELGANQPFRLDAADQAWLVLEGKVEIFAVRAKDVDGQDPEGLPGGGRSHLVTVGVGEMLFGLRAGLRESPFGRRESRRQTDAALLAVPHPGTRVAESHPAGLTRLAREPQDAALLEAAVDDWVQRLFKRIPRKDVPRHFVELRAGQETRFDEVDIGRAIDGLVWVRHVAGETAFLGRAELSLGVDDALVPIGEETWLTAADEEVRVSCVATGHLLRSGTLWEELHRFHELFLRYVALLVVDGEEDERERLGRRRELDQEIFQAASVRLAAVLNRDQVQERGVGGTLSESGDSLMAACRVVANVQKLELVMPPDADNAPTANVKLHRIFEASRCRLRSVLLRGDWWRQDAGPLLAFIDEDKERGAQEEQQGEEAESPEAESPDTKAPKLKAQRLAALLPTSPTSYDLVDPAKSRRVRVDAAVAETLDNQAFMVYAKLPDRPVKVPDLLRLALRGRAAELLTILLTGLGGGALSLMVPIVTARLFGDVIPGSDRSQLFQMTLALFAAAGGAAAFQLTRSIAVLRLTSKFDGIVQAAVWDRVLSLPIGFYRRFSVGDLTTRAMGIDAIRNLLMGSVTASFLSLIFAGMSFALLFYYSVEMALLATLMISVLVVATASLAYLQLRYQRQLRRIEGRIASLVFALIDGVSKLRTSGAEKRAFALWAERFAEQREKVLETQRLAIVQSVLNSAYGALATAGLFAMMGRAMDGGLAVSSFLAFSAAFGQVQSAALSFSSMISGLLAIVPIYERLSPILDETPEVDASKAPAGELSGDVEMSHVSFRYDESGPMTLDDFSLRVRPGEFVALVGPSGSGKSTALRLLLGFEKPAAGSIYYDGQDLALLDTQTVRRQVGVVLQNSQPTAGDVFSNIAGGKSIGIETAWEAARMAGLADDIDGMPMGMHTVVSPGGGTFSGGQIQRLMIARAIVQRPRIIFFDEATSALDNRTQDVVSRSLERLKATRIVVAHRLSTVRNADRIYYLSGGRLVEQGSYEELMARDGAFARLAERQIV